MFNQVNLLGRLVRDPEVKYTQTGKAVAQITLAVDRIINGEKKADFFPCVLWEKQAELVGNNVVKGDRLLVSGSLTTRSYEDKTGQKRNLTEVIVQRIEFIEKKNSNEYGTKAEQSGFDSMGSVDTDSIPF